MIKEQRTLLKNYKKKVLLVNYEMTYTGSPKALLNLAKLLQRNYCVVDVWTFNNGPFESEFKKIGINVKAVQDYKDKNLLSEYDFVVANTIFCIDFAYYCQNYVKTYLYVMEAGNIGYLMEHCLLDEEKFLTIKNVICVSEYAKQEIQKRYDLKNIYVLHNYVEDRSRYYKKMTYEKKTRFIVSGTVEKRKGQDIAIDAFNKLSEIDRDNSELFILGNCPEWSKEYQDKIFKDLPSNIKYINQIKDFDLLYNFYKQMDVFIVSSRDESCSLVALEAAMLKKPMILSDNTGAKYMIKEKFVFETNNADELKELMEYFLNHRKRVLFEGIRNRVAYKKKATKRSVNKEIKKLFFDC